MEESIKDTKYQKIVLFVSLIVLAFFVILLISDSLDLFELIGIGDYQVRSRQQPVIFILVALLLAVYSARNLMVNNKVIDYSYDGLDKAPQLFPYFFSAESFNLRWNNENLKLVPVENKKTNIWDYLRIESESNETLGLVGVWTYLKAIDESKFLCFNTYNLDEKSICYIELVDTGFLRPISKVESERQYLEDSPNQRFFNGTTVKISIPCNLKVGINTFSFPESFKDVDELAIIATKNDIYDGEPMEQYWEKFVLLLLRPKISEIEIIKMDWFNKSDVDHGYVWPARIGRSLIDNKLYGQGMRMGMFTLDPTGHFRIDK